MMRDAIAALMQALASLVFGVLLYAIPRVTEQVRKRTRSTRLAQLLEIAANVVAIVVASIYQTTVKDLKDPTTPSRWTDAARIAVKQQAVDVTRQMIPPVLQEIEGHGVRDIDGLLSRMVEQSVVNLNAKLAQTEVVRASLRPPPLPADTTPSVRPVVGPADVGWHGER